MLAALIWPEVEGRAGKDVLRHSVLRQKTVDFDLADRILCRMDCPELWIEDLDLWEAYQQVDMAALDADRPTVVADAA